MSNPKQNPKHTSKKEVNQILEKALHDAFGDEYRINFVRFKTDDNKKSHWETDIEQLKESDFLLTISGKVKT